MFLDNHIVFTIYAPPYFCQFTDRFKLYQLRLVVCVDPAIYFVLF